MGLLVFSDLVIVCTLIINVLALLSTNFIGSSTTLQSSPETYFSPLWSRIKRLLLKIRKLSLLVVIWNCAFVILMLFIFS